MGMSRHDAYYEPYDYDDRTDEIEERAWQLMKPGARFDYRTTGAISEMMSDLGVGEDKDLQAAIDSGNYEAIGRKIMMMTMEYMERYAKDWAEGEIND
jgi:hypothetical protein